jgi:hypothetical protein
MFDFGIIFTKMNKAYLVFRSILLSAVLCQSANAQKSEKDTIYKIGDFLIHSRDTMKIAFVRKSASFKRESDHQDILFEDDKYLISGNAGKLGYYEPFGVYRKYRLPYKFSTFKVGVYTGKLAAPDFKTNSAALLFRTQIKSQCKTDGINFAGHFTIAHWGCGSSCEDIAIIDRINGRIFYSNVIKEPFDSFYTFKCRPDSKMIMMNDWLLSNIYKGYVFCSDKWPLEIGTWDGSKLKFLTVSPLKYNINLQ